MPRVASSDAQPAAPLWAWLVALAAFDGGLWLALAAAEAFVEPISRRTCNAAYVLWVAAHGTLSLLCGLLVQLCRLPHRVVAVAPDAAVASGAGAADKALGAPPLTPAPPAEPAVHRASVHTPLARLPASQPHKRLKTADAASEAASGDAV